MEQQRFRRGIPSPSNELLRESRKSSQAARLISTAGRVFDQGDKKTYLGTDRFRICGHLMIDGDPVAPAMPESKRAKPRKGDHAKIGIPTGKAGRHREPRGVTETSTGARCWESRLPEAIKGFRQRWEAVGNLAHEDYEARRERERLERKRRDEECSRRIKGQTEEQPTRAGPAETSSADAREETAQQGSQVSGFIREACDEMTDSMVDHSEIIAKTAGQFLDRQAERKARAQEEGVETISAMLQTVKDLASERRKRKALASFARKACKVLDSVDDVIKRRGKL